jgi:glycosyltransferase involved in cell wall biosynthesis
MKPDPPSARRVLVIGPTPPPIGGDTVSTQALLESDWWGDAGLEPLHLESSRGDRVRGALEPLGPADLLRGAALLTAALRMIPRTRAVCLWANSRFLCTVGLPIIVAARLMGRPVAVKPFGGYLAEYLRGLGAIRRRITIGILGKAAFIFPQTRGMAGELARESGISEERIVCMPNFVSGVVSRRAPKDRGFTGRCVFAGQIKREKGVFDIIESFSGMDRFSCDLYGPVLDRDRAEFFDALAKRPNVRYRGIVEPAEVRGIIGSYDLLLLPSYHAGEGYPGVILEAFAAGVPVVASRWKSIPELVDDGERGLLVPVGDPASIRGALERLEREPELYRRMCCNVGPYVESFSERAVVRDIFLLRVRDLVDGRGSTV